MDPVKVIEQLMVNRDQIFQVCNGPFHKKKSIIDASFLTLQSEFSKVENFPKMLAAYIDTFIVQNGRNIESEETREGVDAIFNMISLTAERVDFLHFYEQTLSNFMGHSRK